VDVFRRLRLAFVEPILDIHAGAWTPENDLALHSEIMRARSKQAKLRLITYASASLKGGGRKPAAAAVLRLNLIRDGA